MLKRTGPNSPEETSGSLSLHQGEAGSGNQHIRASRKIFSRVVMDLWLWIQLNIQEHRRLAEEQPPKKRTKMLKQAKALEVCAIDYMTRYKEEASGCSKPGERGKVHCGRRGCLLHRRSQCIGRYERLNRIRRKRLELRIQARRRSQRSDIKEKLKDARASLRRLRGKPFEKRQDAYVKRLEFVQQELASGWAWWFVTVSPQFDPFAEEDVTVRALRENACALRDMEPQLRAGLFGEVSPCMAGVSRIECGRHGLVHLHMLYWGPFRSKEDLRAIVAQVLPGKTRSHVKQVEPTKAQRTLRYITKPDGMKAKVWKKFKAGIRCKVPHPVLDARWEQANRKMGWLTKAWGLWRGAAK